MHIIGGLWDPKNSEKEEEIFDRTLRTLKEEIKNLDFEKWLVDSYKNDWNKASESVHLRGLDEKEDIDLWRWSLYSIYELPKFFSRLIKWLGGVENIELVFKDNSGRFSFKVLNFEKTKWFDWTLKLRLLRNSKEYFTFLDIAHIMHLHLFTDLGGFWVSCFCNNEYIQKELEGYLKGVGLELKGAEDYLKIKTNYENKKIEEAPGLEGLADKDKPKKKQPKKVEETNEIEETSE